MLQFATERLLSGEIADRISIRRQHYGFTVCLAGFGHRVIVDLVTSPDHR